MTLRKWQLENLFDEDATTIFVVCTIISQTLTKVTTGTRRLNCNFAKKVLTRNYCHENAKKMLTFLQGTNIDWISETAL